MSKEDIKWLKKMDEEYFAKQHWRGRFEIEVKEDGTLYLGCYYKDLGDLVPAPDALRIAHLIIARQSKTAMHRVKDCRVFVQDDGSVEDPNDDENPQVLTRERALKLAYAIIQKYGAPEHVKTTD